MATLSFGRDLNSNHGFDPFETGFDFAVALNSDWIKPEYGVLSIRRSEFVYETNAEGKEVRNKYNYDLEVVECGVENFNYHDKELIKKTGLDRGRCIKDKKVELQGNFYSKVFKYL